MSPGTPHYTPRTIALLCELLHPPLRPDPAGIQRIHNRMFEGGAPLYGSFSVTPLGPVLSNVSTRPGAVSQVAFLADRFQFREELSSLTTGEFAERVVQVASMAAEQQKVTLLTAQQVTLRTLVNPRHYKDSVALLQDGMLGMQEEVEVFGRDPRMWGLRLIFPAVPDEPNAFALRIETYTADPRSLFLENQGTFGPHQVQLGLDAVAANIEATYGFLVDRALPFVGRFDVRAET